MQEAVTYEAFTELGTKSYKRSRRQAVELLSAGKVRRIDELNQAMLCGYEPCAFGLCAADDPLNFRRCPIAAETLLPYAARPQPGR